MTEIEKILEPYKGTVPGCAILVFQNDSPVLVETQGYADLENKIPVTTETNFRLASVSKHFTAMAILELRKRGLLSLDTKLGELFLDFADYGKNVTLEQLLTHTSGFINYEEIMDKSYAGQIHDRDVFDLLARQNQGYFEPGSKFRYSNGGYCILAVIVEKVSGKTLADFLRTEFFIPLGMKNTFVNEEGTTTIPNRAYGYSKKDEEWVRTDQDATSATIGDGGIYSSLDDLAIWDRSLDTLNLFEKEVLTDEKPAPIYYGFGLFGKEYKGLRVQYHPGSSIGFRTGFYRVPEKKLLTVFLSNRNEGVGIKTCERILDMVDPSKTQTRI